MGPCCSLSSLRLQDSTFTMTAATCVTPPVGSAPDQRGRTAPAAPPHGQSPILSAAKPSHLICFDLSYQEKHIDVPH